MKQLGFSTSCLTVDETEICNARKYVCDAIALLAGPLVGINLIIIIF